MLRVSRQTLADEINRGHIPGQKIGREFRILESSVLQYLQGRSVDRDTDNVAVLGVETLSSVEALLFHKAVPTAETLVEFDNFCDAVAFHDKIYVAAEGADFAQLPVLDAFSSFISARSLSDLRASLDDSLFRDTLARRINEAIGGVSYISPDRIASRGIELRDRTAGILQERFFQILIQFQTNDLRPEIAKLFRDRLNGPPSDSQHPDVNYFLRAFLYDAVAEIQGWSYIPNFTRSVLLQVLGQRPQRTRLFQFMSDVSQTMCEMFDSRERQRQRRWTAPRSSAAYVLFNRAQQPDRFADLLLQVRDELGDLRKLFADLLGSIRAADDISGMRAAIGRRAAELQAMTEHAEFSDDTNTERFVSGLLAGFFSSINVSARNASAAGLAVNGRAELMKEGKRAIDRVRFAPLLAFCREVARCSADFEEVLRRLYGMDELAKDSTAVMMEAVRNNLAKLEVRKDGTNG